MYSGTKWLKLMNRCRSLSWAVFFGARERDKEQEMRQGGSGSYHMNPSLCRVIDFQLSLRLFCFMANPSFAFDPRRALSWYAEALILSSSSLHPSISLSFYPNPRPHYNQAPEFLPGLGSRWILLLPRRKGRETRCHQILLKSNPDDLSSSRVALPSSRHKMIGFTAGIRPF